MSNLCVVAAFSRLGFNVHELKKTVHCKHITYMPVIWNIVKIIYYRENYLYVGEDRRALDLAQDSTGNTAARSMVTRSTWFCLRPQNPLTRVVCVCV